ncbi:Isoleucine--tRNA ligase [uncultured archaeon]|nr:Isoleucine--tRNA ligase [uncultured archaeon]
MILMKPLESYSLAKEEEIRKFWKEKGVPGKARKLNQNGEGFYMMDGPPYASGHIHMGTALNKIVKDITMRRKRMQGFSVLDQPGYDTHGLPIENKVEKELNFTSKSDIEKYGVENFIGKCREYATQYIGIMNSEFDNLGVWMDWQDPYLTLDNKYIEAIWWTFKKAEEKGLLYLGKYPIHACTHCETAVAYNEIEYVKQKDSSIYVKFRAIGKDGKSQENKFLIIWTTTPWTLPSNTGVMAHPKFEYVEVQVGTETWVLAKERLEPLMELLEAGFTIKKKLTGKDLEGTMYENPLAKNLTLGELHNAYRVIMSDRYVNVEDGTGLVHCAPGCGKEDYDAGTKAGLPVVSIVGLSGMLEKEAGKYAGKKARVVDSEIIADLREMNCLVAQVDYTHDYPVCWRCKTPLLMISTPQWFFRVTAIRERMLELNEKVKWHPEWGKDRFRNWLENLGDWPVSRQRYWGTPLPIWVCGSCQKKTVVASAKELKKLSGSFPGDLHKPWIDSIKWKCECGGTFERVPEVLDVWFDSGVTSWGSLGYPENEGKFVKYWPADINIEGKDQIRGWWNSQLITSTICFDEKPFKEIAMHGMVLDLGKRKMSKSEGNIVSPKEVMEKHNRDYLRHYIARGFSGEDMAFDWEAFREIQRFYNTFWNSYNYAAIYLDLDFTKAEKIDAKRLKAEDRWIVSKLHSMLREANEAYEKYDYPKVVSLAEYFVLEEFSRTYIKMVRDRAKEDKAALSQVFSHVMYSLIRLLAPIVPHMSEFYYQHSRPEGMPESVHYTSLPQGQENCIDKNIETEVEKAKALLEAVLSLREEQKLRLRWPLQELVYMSAGGKEFPNAMQIIADGANVKKFSETKAEPKGNYAAKAFGEGKLFLNTEANEALREEWELMELRRRIQDMRKQAKLNPSQVVETEFDCSDRKFLEKYRKEIEQGTGTRIVAGKGKMEKVLEREFYINLRK